MEYVPGIPITEYCDKHRLTTEERLLLFIDVCNAIQHAHQKGIIHRDIKPSNVLVAVDAAAGGSLTETSRAASASNRAATVRERLSGVAVKVIDFGVAKATQHRLTERTLFTEQGQLIGTPGYMSPEQAEMTALDIDTRTDIYSLGVLLYELMVGARPFNDETLLKARFAEIQRVIREVDPPKPSTKLSSLGSDSTTIAQKRRTDVRALSRQVRGDLDWIIMKCLEKDRTRRYDTANGLALEIARHLNNEPVLAGPPSTGYRMRKFVRRNKGPVAAALALFVVVLAGLAGTTYGLAQAVKAREAEAEQRRFAEDQEQKALAARDEAEAVTNFLTETLAAVAPSKQGRDITVREVLDKAAERIGEKFVDKPLLEARLCQTVGLTYHGLGLYDRAQVQCTQAAALFGRHKGERDPVTLAAIDALATVLHDRGGYAAAEAAHRANLEVRRRVLGEEHPDTLVSMNNLASSLSDQGRYAEAEELHRETLEVRRRVLGDEHPDLALTLHNLADTLEKRKHWTEAEALCREAEVLWATRFPQEHVYRRVNANLLGGILTGLRRFEEAEPLLTQTFEPLLKRDAVLSPREKQNALERIVHLYEGWDAAEPGKGYAEKVTEWRAKLEELQATQARRHPDWVGTSSAAEGNDETKTPGQTQPDDN